MLRVITDEESGDLAEVYLKSDDFSRLKAELDTLKESPDEDLKIEYQSEFAVPRTTRRSLVNKRLQLIYWRSPAYNLSRISVSLVIAFVLGSVFITTRRLPQYTETDMRARLSVIFLAFIITGIMAILSVLPVMTKTRDMFYRHRDAGMYDSASIGLALGVAEKYFIILSTALFSVVFLPASGLGYTSGLGNGVERLIGFWVSQHRSRLEIIFLWRLHHCSVYASGFLHFQLCNLFLHGSAFCLYGQSDGNSYHSL
jgi:hypothetical protein